MANQLVTIEGAGQTLGSVAQMRKGVEGVKVFLKNLGILRDTHWRPEHPHLQKKQAEASASACSKQ